MAVVVVLCVLLAVQSGVVLSVNNSDFGGVSLTVEGGGSELVGPHCPGTVRLVCEGVDLTLLRWTYNDDIKIDSGSFAPDLNISSKVHILPPPFVSVELTSVSQSNNPRLANFSSVLIANLSQLEQESVTNISCGDTSTLICTLPVNITIIEESIVEDPQINVDTTQNSSYVLLGVYWEQQTIQGQGCTAQLEYIVTLLWNGTNYMMTINSSSCGAQCSIEFSITSLERDENYTVYLQAISQNGVGESNISIYNGTIYYELQTMEQTNSTLYWSGTSTAALIECPPPQPPFNGNVGNHSSTSLLGTTLTYQCDFYPNGVRIAVCTNVAGRGEWVPDPAQFQCKDDISNDNDSSETAILSAIAGGVGAGCLTVGVVILLGIGVKCAYSHYQKKEVSSPLSMDESNGDMELYSTLNHHGTGNVQRQPFPDLTADNAELYDRIELHPSRNTKSLNYTDVSTHLNDCTVMLPSPWPGVNYATVDIEATEERAALTPEAVQEDQEVDEVSEVDKLLNLDQSLVQLRAVHSKWREIGAALCVPETHIEQVESYYPNDDTAAMTEMLDYWIRDCSWSHTWRELAEVLSKVGEIAAAQQLMQAYETGQLPIQIDFTQVPDTMYKGGYSTPPPLPPRSPSVSSNVNQQTLSVQSTIEVPPKLPPKSTSIKNQAKV